MQTQMTEQMIEKIVAAVIGPVPAPRQAYYLREALHHLVRLAQCEQALDAKRCSALASEVPSKSEAQRKSRAAARKLMTDLRSRQERLNFETKLAGYSD
jgi:hypothetical protein